MNTLTRLTVDLIKGNPLALAAMAPEDRPADSDLAEPPEIVLNADARAVEALPAGEDVSTRVVDQLTETVLCVIREDEHTLLAGIDAERTDQLAARWSR